MTNNNKPDTSPIFISRSLLYDDSNESSPTLSPDISKIHTQSLNLNDFSNHNVKDFLTKYSPIYNRPRSYSDSFNFPASMVPIVNQDATFQPSISKPFQDFFAENVTNTPAWINAREKRIKFDSNLDHHEKILFSSFLRPWIILNLIFISFGIVFCVFLATTGLIYHWIFVFSFETVLQSLILITIISLDILKYNFRISSVSLVSFFNTPLFVLRIFCWAYLTLDNLYFNFLYIIICICLSSNIVIFSILIVSLVNHLRKWPIVTITKSLIVYFTVGMCFSVLSYILAGFNSYFVLYLSDKMILFDSFHLYYQIFIIIAIMSDIIFLTLLIDSQIMGFKFRLTLLFGIPIWSLESYLIYHYSTTDALATQHSYLAIVLFSISISIGVVTMLSSWIIECFIFKKQLNSLRSGIPISNFHSVLDFESSETSPHILNVNTIEEDLFDNNMSMSAALLAENIE